MICKLYANEISLQVIMDYLPILDLSVVNSYKPTLHYCPRCENIMATDYFLDILLEPVPFIWQQSVNIYLKILIIACNISSIQLQFLQIIFAKKWVFVFKTRHALPRALSSGNSISKLLSVEKIKNSKYVKVYSKDKCKFRHIQLDSPQLVAMQHF